MTRKSPDHPLAAAEPLWVNPGFSTRELNGSLIRIQWLRDGRTLEEGVYRLSAQGYGHSRHILNIRAALVSECGCSIAAMELDQADAEQIHRSNEAPKQYQFVARLERDRPRRQNQELAKFVRERRVRKAQDTSGSDDWEMSIAPVLHPAPVHIGHCRLPERLDQPGSDASPRPKQE